MTTSHLLDDKKRLLGVSGLSVAAAGLAALLPATAHAVPVTQVFTPASPLSFPIPVANGDYGNLYWDAFSADSSSNFTYGYLNLSGYYADGSFTYLEYGCSFPYNLNIIGSGDPGSPAMALNFGDLIDGSSPIINYYASVDPLPLGTSYFGFRYDYPDSGTYGYGWVELSNDGTNYSLEHWAFTTGPEMTVGAGVTSVPEPASIAAISGLFFAGVVALARWKKRRTARLA